MADEVATAEETPGAEEVSNPDAPAAESKEESNEPNDDAKTGVKYKGVVNWFNVAKGFGFVTRDDGVGDVFVHQSDIYAEGFRSLRDQEPVEFELEPMGDGRYKAVKVTGPDGAFVRGALPRNSYRQRGPYTMARGGMRGPGMTMMGNGVGFSGFDAYGQLGMMGPGMSFPGMMSPMMGGIPGYPGGPGGPPMGGMGPGGPMGMMGGMGGMMGSPPNGPGGPVGMMPPNGPAMGDGDGGGPPSPLPLPLGGGFGNPPGTKGGPIGGKRVVVLNLPWQTTWQALKEFFAGVGAITRAEIASDEDGRSRGYGTVRFSSEEEAARAIATLNGAEFEGRIITVRMDKYQQ